jgi:peptide/nickel transport system substrate-binding protein
MKERFGPTPSRRLVLLVGAIAIVVAAALFGTAHAGDTRTAASSPFVVASDNVGTSLDPAVASDQPSLQLATPVYETLVNYNATSKQLQPALATGWKISNGGKTITLTLRKGVKFHDGSILNAAGVVASLQRTLAVGKGESFLISSLAHASAVGSGTVKLTLKTASSDFLYSLTRIFIVSGQAVKAHAGSDNGQSWFASHEAGSGPYTVTSWQPNDHATLQAFRGYWRGWKGQHVQQFQFQQVASPETQQLDVEQGKADFANAIPIDSAVKLRSSNKVKVLIYPGSPFYIMFNAARPPLNKVSVRQALALAVPYQQITKQIMSGTATPLTGPIPKWMPGADPSLKVPTTNIAKAKSLLAAAGYSSKHPLTLRLAYYPGWTFEQTIATDYQYQLSQIGVKLQIDALPWATFTQQIAKPSTRPDMGSIAVYVPIPSPGPTLSYSFDPASAGNWAYWGYSNATFTKLLHKAQTTSNPAQRAALYRQAERKLVNDYAGAWTMEMPDVYVISPKVHGVQHDASWGVVLNCYGVWKS